MAKAKTKPKKAVKAKTSKPTTAARTAKASGPPAKKETAAKAKANKTATAIPAVAHAHEAKLEAAIAAAPDDPDNYLVYADWLQAQGDPRGELVVLQHGKRTAAANKLLDKHAAHFWGPLAGFVRHTVPYEYNPRGAPTTWRWGYLEKLWLSQKYDDGDHEDFDVAKALGEVLDHPSARFLRELTVGIVFLDETNHYVEIAKTIGKRSLPLLRKLILGDFYYEETELNWSRMGKIEPLYKAVPNLESLTLRSGSMELGKIDLPNLRELVIITGGFDKKSLASIFAAKWPHLERLHLQFGRDHAFSVDDLKPIFDGAIFPKVVHLGLGNAQFTDAICDALARSKIAGRLKSLDLTLGTMGDGGANALARAKQRFPELELIDVSDNYLTNKGLAAIKHVADKVVSKGKRGQRDDGGDPENRYISGYE